MFDKFKNLIGVTDLEDEIQEDLYEEELEEKEKRERKDKRNYRDKITKEEDKTTYKINKKNIDADLYIIKPENLQFTATINNDIPSLGTSLNLSDVEKFTIKEALFKNKGNINKTAKELGVTRKTLYNKIEKYEL